MRRKTLEVQVLNVFSSLALFSSLAIWSALALGCADTSGGEPRVRVIPNKAEPAAVLGGIPPDKQAEIQLVLQQRDTQTLKCYQDVLNEKHDRAFQGTVQVLITIEPSGHASQVKVVGGTLTDETVQDCLVQTLKEFEFPQLAQSGDVQYEYRFRPAY